jgi:hypothetical protein
MPTRNNLPLPRIAEGAVTPKSPATYQTRSRRDANPHVQKARQLIGELRTMRSEKKRLRDLGPTG